MNFAKILRTPFLQTLLVAVSVSYKLQFNLSCCPVYFETWQQKQPQIDWWVTKSSQNIYSKRHQNDIVDITLVFIWLALTESCFDAKKVVFIADSVVKPLKELRNCTLCIIRVWSKLCSVWIYISRHFLPILLVKLGFRLSMFWFFVFLYLRFWDFLFSVLNSMSC